MSREFLDIMLDLARFLEVSVELPAAIPAGVFVAPTGFEELAPAVR